MQFNTEPLHGTVANEFVESAVILLSDCTMVFNH